MGLEIVHGTPDEARVERWRLGLTAGSYLGMRVGWVLSIGGAKDLERQTSNRASRHLPRY